MKPHFLLVKKQEGTAPIQVKAQKLKTFPAGKPKSS